MTAAGGIFWAILLFWLLGWCIEKVFGEQK